MPQEKKTRNVPKYKTGKLTLTNYMGFRMDESERAEIDQFFIENKIRNASEWFRSVVFREVRK